MTADTHTRKDTHMTRTITPGQICPGMTIRATKTRGPITTVYQGLVTATTATWPEWTAQVTLMSRDEWYTYHLGEGHSIEVLAEPTPPEPQGLWSTVSWHEPAVGDLVALNTGKDWLLLAAGQEAYTNQWVIPWEHVITLSAGARLTIHDTTDDKENDQ